MVDTNALPWNYAACPQKDGARTMNGYARCSRALSWAVGAGYNHTVSAHVGRAVALQRAPQSFWRVFAWLLDKAFCKFEANHCQSQAEKYFSGNYFETDQMEYTVEDDPRTKLGRDE
jgi:hypothetical protein